MFDLQKNNPPPHPLADALYHVKLIGLALCWLLLLAGPAWSDDSSVPLEGKASWIGERFQGKKTVCGELFDMNDLVGSHATLPCGTVVKVTSLSTGKQVNVKINNRMEISSGRVIDLSRRAAEQIGLIQEGVGNVRLQVISTGVGGAISGNSTSATTTSTSANTTDTYLIQYGVFADFDNSLELRQSLKSKGVLADVEKFTQNGKTLYRVNGMQRYNTTDDARNALIAIAPTGGIIKQAQAANAGSLNSGVPSTTSDNNTSPGGLEYGIQFGAYDSVLNAKQRQAGLISAKGVSTIIHSFPDDERRLYRVLSNKPFRTKEEAQRFLESKGEQGIILTFVQ